MVQSLPVWWRIRPRAEVLVQRFELDPSQIGQPTWGPVETAWGDRRYRMALAGVQLDLGARRPPRAYVVMGPVGRGRDSAPG